MRLTPIGRTIGLAEEEREIRLEEKNKNVSRLIQFLDNQSIDPQEINPVLEALNSPPVEQKVKAAKILLRPQVSLESLKEVQSIRQTLSEMPEEDATEAEIAIKYESYIAKEKEAAQKLKRLENIKLHPDFDYRKITSLSNEAREKLSTIKPRTLGQAGRISGVSPADISVLLVYFGR